MIRFRGARLAARLAALETKLAPPPPGLPPPRIITQYVGCRRDVAGNLLGPNLDFTQAQIADRTFERGETESLADFQARVLANGVASEVCFMSGDTIEDG